MNIFNSLGSNYDFGFVLKALFANNKPSHSSNLKSFLEKKYQGKTILVYKGREAIGLALEILKLPKESCIAINGFTCYAVYKSINNEGYETELLDLENSLDLNFSAETLEKALKQNPKIKVVIIQNTLGYPCDIERIAKVCKDNNIILIEDLAHSVGTVYKNGKDAGTIGDFVILSFSQDKIIDAVSGGALIIRNKKYQNPSLASQGLTLQGKQQMIDRIYPLLTFVIRNTYQIGIGKLIHFILKSLNLLSKPMNEGFYTKYNLPGWYAYLAMDPITNLNKNLEHRRKIAQIYKEYLDKKILRSRIFKKISLSSNLRFPIFVEKRSDLIKFLEKFKIFVSDIWYDDVSPDCPNAVKISKTILNLPTHINVTEKDAVKICERINEWLKSQ
jgi:dTDP-4-amino-4,6-dideoxygalactose transaminase